MVVLIALGMVVLYLIAYHTYGKFLARKIFRLNPATVTPANTLRDDKDYLPTRRQILFGHHYTSIAGTGPIVGPAIAIIWGWVPALLWIIFGSIFMGAVHDFGAIVISVRHQGKSIGDIAGDVIRPWVRILFLVLVYLTLLIVLAVFVLVIANLFDMYPQAVLPVWLQIPIAMGLGWLIYRRNVNPVPWTILAVALMYGTVLLGAYVPVKLPTVAGFTPLVTWGLLLFIYAFFASTLPVWKLLQPRDYINGYQLIIAMCLLGLGVLIARPPMLAPAVNPSPPGAPPMLPFLFITIACGAISGFHSLVGSGTTSKQLAHEQDALPIGYGAMLLEGVLATLVLIAAGAGIGLHYVHTLPGGGAEILTGKAAFLEHYASWGAAKGLGAKVGAFVQGAANMLAAYGIPMTIGLTLMGMFVASFAGTTLDTATRIQRYIISELSETWHFKPLTGRYGATLFAVVTGALLAYAPVHDPQTGVLVFGKGGLILWPLFGTSNQLLAALSLTVVSVYLVKRRIAWYYTALPMVLMIGMTSWAMVLNIEDFLLAGKIHLLLIGAILLGIEVFIIIASIQAVRTVALQAGPSSAGEGGRSPG